MNMLLMYTITVDKAQFYAKIKTTANNTCTNNLAKPVTLRVKNIIKSDKLIVKHIFHKTQCKL